MEETRRQVGGRRGRWRTEPWRERGQGGGQRGEKEEAEEPERGVQTPGTGEGKGPQGRGTEGGTKLGRPSHQGQGRRKRGEMGQGGEEGRGGEGTDGGEEFGVRKQVREGGGRGAGGQTELPKRRRRRRREWRPSRERDRERERVRESWGRPWGGERGGGRGWVPAGPTCSATSRTDWTLVP